MARKSSKKAILDAAERVIRRQGMAATTLEDVAAEAGISKGGLFYHFASKKEMLSQLLVRYEEQFRAFRDEIHATLPKEPTSWLKATILASLRHPAKSETSISNILGLLDDVELRQKLGEMKLRLFTEITSNYPNPERAALALLAADGLWVMDLFGVPMPSGELEEKIIGELLRLIDIHAGSDMQVSAEHSRGGEAEHEISFEGKNTES